MSKYTVKELWDKIYGKQEQCYDYAGRLMLKSACGNPNSQFEPTIDHIRPLAKRGKNNIKNMIICHCKTNEEKGNSFPCWKANGRRFCAIKNKDTDINAYYTICPQK